MVPEQEEQAAREVLLARWERIQAELVSLDKRGYAQDSASRPQYGKRAGDHIAEALEQRRNVATAQTLRQEEQEIGRALEKLREGTYGRCDRCQGAIGAERLAALPWANLCVECKRQTERRHR